MAQAKIFEGTWKEMLVYADEFRKAPKLTIIVPDFDEQRTNSYRTDLTPQERIQRLDALAEQNRHLPALPPEAFDRECLYAEEEETNAC